MSAHKLVSLVELREIVREARQKKLQIVFTNGCFDLIHIGHIRYLREASKYGDILITAINSDESVKNLKGSGRPVFNEHERAEMLSCMEFIDYIIIFNEDDVSALLLALKPDFHAKGTDYTPDTVPEKDIVSSYGGRVIITGDDKSRSSRDLVKHFKK